MDIKAQFTKEVNRYLDYILKQLGNNKEFLSGMGVGAFLMTPPGQKIVKEAAKYSKQLAVLTKDLGKNVCTELWRSALESKLGKTNFAENAVKGTGKTGKISEGIFKTSAAMIAGKAIGASLGKTIAAGKDWWKHVNPISATVDIVKVVRDETKEKNAQEKAEAAYNRAAAKQVKELVNAIPKYSATGERDKISVYTGFNYDEEAKKLGLGSRPTNAQAENQWKKEVEKQMKSSKTKVSKLNDASWYNRGDAAKINAGTLTWSSVKTNSEADGYPFVCASAVDVLLTMPMEGEYIHPRVKQNINVLFQALRGKNTGAFNYDEEDVFNYVYALSTLIARLRYLQKVLRLANVHDVLVDNLPVGLTDLAFVNSLSSGTTYNEIVHNAPNFISRINSLVEELNTYALPGNTLISRWNYIADKGFRDYNGKQAVYCFYKVTTVPRFVVGSQLMVDHTFGETGFPYTNNDPFNVELTLLENDIHAFRTLGHHSDYTTASNTMVKISGDMIKLLGANASTFANVPYYTGNPVQSFDYDVEAIDQLRNAKLFFFNQINYYANYNTQGHIHGSIHDTAGASLHTLADTAKYWNDGFILTTERNIGPIGPENVQLVQFFWNARVEKPSSTSYLEQHLSDCTPTVVTGIKHQYYVPGTRSFAYVDELPFMILGTSSRLEMAAGAVTITNSAIRTQIRMQVDYVPQPEMIDEPSGNPITTKGQMVDVDNFCYITKRQFRELLNVAAYSMTFYFEPSQLNINGII